MKAAAYKIEGGDFEHGGAASRDLKAQLKQIGADPAVIRRAMVAAYEAEMNVVIHAHRGELRATLENGQLDVEVIDEGPGIPDLECAMRPGFSTASASARELGFGAGMGLPNIKKNSDHFAIESTVGRGTSVRFSVLLKSPALYGVSANSIRVSADCCQESLHCLHVCPTQAVRVFRGKPQILDYRCIDCTACIAVCPSGALRIADAAAPDAARLPAPDGAVLVLPPGALVQFGDGAAPTRVLGELAALHWNDIRTLDAWDAALRAAVVEYACGDAHLPAISPACPAVVNLIRTRYPSLLPNVAPFVSAIEAARADLAGRRAVFVISCPSQRTALLAGDGVAAVDLATPAAFRNTIMLRLAHLDRTSPPAPSSRATPLMPDARVLRVNGLSHVVRTLEAIEDGLASDFAVVEPWACDEGCFGSPLLADDAFLARRRWETAPATAGGVAQAVRRTPPLTPRPGLRLDDDMAKAIQKLAKIDKLTRSLPGSDCAICGAPTCAALAEDIVLGRTASDACPRQSRAAAPPGQENTP